MTPSTLRARARAFLRALTLRKSTQRMGPDGAERPRRRLQVEGLETRIVPFKPYTHVAIAAEARADILDDGMITIEGREYPVSAEVVAAIRDNEAYFNAGVVGPDGFPDLVMGQGVIHPTNVGDWMNYVLTSARNYTGPDRAQVLAWSHGFLCHVIGDMWAHTLVNEFTGGPFPDTGSVVSEQASLANALRHIIVEGYIGDATPGYDDNPNRTQLPGGDVSDDSTPGIAYAAPRGFIYDTFVREGSGPAGNTTDKGAIINFFYGLRDSLRTAAGPRPVNPIDLLTSSFDNTKAAYDNFVHYAATPEVFFNPFDEDFDDAWAALGTLGITSLVDGVGAALTQAENAVNAARFALYGHYLHAWADDIDTGLQHWSEFGLGLTNAFFNAQSRRNVQNFGRLDLENDLDRINHENGIGLIDTIMFELGEDFTASAHGGQSFLENHLVSMLGVPDVLITIGDRIGDFGAALGSLLDEVKNAFPQLDFIFNPISEGIADIRDKVVDFVKDQVGSALGVDFDQLEAILSAPSSRLDDTSIPYLGQSVPLFHPDDHEKLDGYLGITNPNHHTGPGGILGDDVTFDRAKFAAFGNAVTMTKLSFLDGVVLDQLISDLRGAPYVLYGPGNGNIMTTVLPGVAGAVSNTQWILSADGDHAWRADRQPKPGDGKPGAGSGNFPLWESCLLRDSVFRVLFKDWENGAENFPDLGDDHSHDPNETPPVPTLNPATGELILTGSPQDDDLRLSSFVDAGIAYISISFPHTIYYCEETFNFPAADITKITVLGMDGNDSLTIDGVVSKPIEFIGGQGADGLNIDDSANASATTGSLTATTVTGLGVIPAGVTYDGTTENLLIELGSGNDSFTVQSTNPSTKVILNTGDGNDSAFVSFSPSELTINMGAGVDLLVGVGNSFDRVYRIQGPGSGIVPALVTGGFSGVENITAGGGADRFVFEGGSIVGTINGGFGYDRIIGDNVVRTFSINGIDSGNIAGLAGAFTNCEHLTGGSAGDTFKFFPGGSVGGDIDGQGGIDRIDFALVNSQSVFLFELGTIDGFTAFTPGLLPIGGFIFNINDLVGSTTGLSDALVGLDADANWQLRAGPGQTSYTHVASGRQLTFGFIDLLYGGTEADRFTVDFRAGTPVPTTGVSVNAGAGADFLGVIGSAARDLFAVYTASFVANRIPIRYSAVESLEARGGNGNDAFTAIATLPSIVTSLRFFGENGNDMAFVMPSTTATMRLEGGAGVDTVTIRPGTARYRLPLPPRGAISGTWFFSNRRPITFVSFETRSIGVLQYAIY